MAHLSCEHKRRVQVLPNGVVRHRSDRSECQETWTLKMGDRTMTSEDVLAQSHKQ